MDHCDSGLEKEMVDLVLRKHVVFGVGMLVVVQKLRRHAHLVLGER